MFMLKLFYENVSKFVVSESNVLFKIKLTLQNIPSVYISVDCWKHERVLLAMDNPLFLPGDRQHSFHTCVLIEWRQKMTWPLPVLL